MKQLGTLIAGLVLAASLAACTDTSPPEGCPDTAPDNLSGIVSGKQVDETKPDLIASNGDECWHLVIHNPSLSNNLISVFVDRRTYKSVSKGDSFKREKLKTK